MLRKLILLVSLLAIHVHAQQPAADAEMENAVKLIRQAKQQPDAQRAIAQRLDGQLPLIQRSIKAQHDANARPRMQLQRAETTRKGIADVENVRQDKQVGATPTASGSTSVVSKGSTSRIVAVAVENGAVKQTIEGTTVTLSTTPLMLIEAIRKNDFLCAGILAETIDLCPDPQISGAVKRFASHWAFAASFDTQRGANAGSFRPGGSQFSGATARYEIYNKRDPRHPEHQKAWNELLSNAESKALAQSAQNFVDSLQSGNPIYEDWRVITAQRLADTASENVQRVLQEQLDKLGRDLRVELNVAAAAREFETARLAFVKTYDEQLTKFKNSALLTVEYKLTRQANIDISKSQAEAENPILGTDGTPLMRLPDMSTLKLIYEQTIWRMEATGNAGLTFFHNLPPNLRISALRDFTASGQLDLPLGSLQPLGKLVASFGGMLIDLRQPPLGGIPKFTLTDREFKEPGKAGVFQAKLTIPGANGVKIPFAFTYATSSDLLPEKAEKRFNVGLQWDLDALFAKQ